MEDTPVIKILGATTCDCCCRREIFTKIVGIKWKENIDSQHRYINIYLCNNCIEHEHTPLIGQNTLQMCPILRQKMLIQSLSTTKTIDKDTESIYSNEEKITVIDEKNTDVIDEENTTVIGEEKTTVIDEEKTTVIDEKNTDVIDEENTDVIDEETAWLEELLTYSF